VADRRSIPFGAWPSPLGAEAVAASSVRIHGLWLDGVDLYWTESRPSEQGRLALLRKRDDGPAEEIVPAPFSVRSRVHEYGGGAFAVASGLVIFCNDSDQRLYRLDAATGAPVALTAPGPVRYADLQVDARRGRVICVVERARDGGEPENLLASVSLATGEVTPLVRGADFYAFPRLHPTGTHLAFVSWNHPDMPWDACALCLAEIHGDGSLSAPVKIAGGADEAIFQPLWSPAGELTFASDRNGFFNLYRLAASGEAVCMLAMEADFAAPPWVFGLATHAWLDGSTLVCSYQQAGLWHLATLDATAGRLDAVKTELTELGSVFAGGGRAVFLGGSPSQGTAIASLEGSTREIRLVHRPSASPLASDAIAYPRPFDFPTAAGVMAHGLLYLPHNPGWQAPASTLPPLLVVCHGGPTGSTSTAFNPSIQFWTSRGFAVLDVNYRGSTGYGRAYRKLLDGQWGVADVEDCVAGAAALARQGLVDGGRMAIRGSSAGGFTVLCALAYHDVFAAGASYYGVCDLEALATDTHKFESRYLDSLVGPYPERRELYRARSPLYAADRLSCPVIFFHGQQDRVVPVAQAEVMVAALRQRGLAAPFTIFADEQHGFRRRETIENTLTAELAFYRQVFGITGC
jgi:dipeptidyl aminopeptidase/acylaminoacyl peptidase